MSDVATVFLAVGPAAITGLVGYFAARFQRDTSRAETDAATLRVRIEHAEAERSHRQGAYHDFLILLERQDAMMRGFAPLDEGTFQELLGAFYGMYQGVHLYGAQGVRDALGPLVDALGKVGAEAASGDASVPIHERLKRAYPRYASEVTEAIAGLTEAMRKDVAPEINLPKLGAALEGLGQPPGE